MWRWRRNLVLVTLCLVGEICFALPTTSLLAATPQQSGDPVVVAAGDISNCSNQEDFLTGSLIDAIDGTVLVLGDNVYEVGSIQEYNDCYGPAWGRHKERTRPVPGNHEYGKGNANDYFAWWGDLATPAEPGCRKDCGGYYSFNVGAWHLIALNSELSDAPDSPQIKWLRADLAANPTVCTLAYWHRPRFTSGYHLGGSGQGLWRTLYEYGADVVLVGHDHDYERFAPQGPNGEYEPDRGIREFVVGTGGAPLRDFKFIQPNSEVRNSETHGVLKLTLHPTSYDWEFIPIVGKTFTDKGSAPCANPTNLPAAPAPTTGSTTPAPATTAVTAPAAGAPTAPLAITPSGSTYTVKAGDTLSLIGLRFGFEWEELAQLNQISDPYVIEIDQVLQLPGKGTPASGTTSAPAAPAVTPPKATTAVTPTATVTTTKPLAPAPAVTATKPVTPTATTKTNTARTHTVAAGDTIITIALKYNLDWLKLLEINGLKPDSLLQIGQEIRLQ